MKMVNEKFDDVLPGRVRGFLELRWSLRVIQKHLKAEGVEISIGHLSKIKNNQENSSKEQRVLRKPGRCQVLSEQKNNLLVQRFSQVNPPTQSAVASELHVSQHLISLQIKRQGLKRLKKPKVHRLSESFMEKRYKHAWPPYRSLVNDQWKKVVTVDEAIFKVNASGIQSEYQYIHINADRSTLAPRETQNFAASVMVFVGISFAGVTKPIFVEPGAKILADY